MSLELIILDCDGVILESMNLKGKAFGRVAEEIGGPEMADRMALYHSMHGGVNRFEKFAWLYDDVFGREMTQEEGKALEKKFVQYAMDELQQCALVPGVEQVLKSWHTRLPIFVASAAPQQELVRILEGRGLAHYFTKICGSPPGKIQMVQNIVQETGVDPEKTIMVGDSIRDLEAAESAGCLFYGRGKRFAGGKYPYSEDLLELDGYLQSLFQS